MSAAPQIVSIAVEKLLNKMSLRVVDPECAGRTAVSTLSLTQAEAASGLAGISRMQFLTLAIWGGFAIERDYHELKHALIRHVLMKEIWFCPEKYLANEYYQQKVDGFLYGAITQIAKGQLEVKPHLIAEYMGITTRAYRKTWADRHLTVHHQLIDWLQQASVSVHGNLKT